MTTDLSIAVEDAAEQPRSRWGFLFSWPSFFLCAWAIYELTSQAALGVPVLCAKFGWDYFRTAWWLRCMDTDKARGKVAFWIFMAGGLWKTAIVAVILMFVYALILAANQKAAPQAAAPKEIVEAAQVAFSAFCSPRARRYGPSALLCGIESGSGWIPRYIDRA